MLEEQKFVESNARFSSCCRPSHGAIASPLNFSFDAQHNLIPPFDLSELPSTAMHFFQVAVLVWFNFRIITAQASNNTKRGLVAKIASNAEDDKIWDRPDSDLTWYYNYDSKPLDLYDGSKLDFVPMCWGQAAAQDFLSNVESALQKGSKISYVLGFNEPDTTSAVGGSSLNPQVAAQVWMQYIEPLASKGVKLGAPACSGAPTGLQWLREFFTACDQCTIDFVPLHWYGNFEGLASHVGEYIAAFNRSTWVTEFALNNASLQDTQAFFKQSTQYMDTLT